MGCDIHAWIEYIEHDAVQCFGSVGFWRNYALFGVLAGVRKHDLPHIEPRGLPPEISFEVRHSYNDWGADAHSASWLTLDEVRTAQGRFMEELAKWPGSNGTYPMLDGVIAVMEVLPGSRLVFWFDN
jgi:hypothetical protein